MIVRATLFYAAAAATALYAMRRGGQPERVTATLVVIASVATSLVPTVPGVTFRTVVWPLLAIDVTLLLGLVVVALAADRFWPIYFTAVHLIAVALHGVRAYDTTILPAVYARVGGELSYPILVILAIGTWRHYRRGPERDWSWQARCDRPYAQAAGART